MTSRTKHWIKFSIRWGIAVVGICWVVTKINFTDRVKVLDPETGRPVYAQVLDNAKEDQANFRILRHNPDGSTREDTVSRDDVWAAPDRKSVEVDTPGGGAVQRRDLLAVRRAGGR